MTGTAQTLRTLAISCAMLAAIAVAARAQTVSVQDGALLNARRRT
jgi:hypothetical protein